MFPFIRPDTPAQALVQSRRRGFAKDIRPQKFVEKRWSVVTYDPFRAHTEE
jgi:hypothetical protein